MCFNVEDMDDHYFRQTLDALLKARRPQESMRGLRSRVLLAKARILALLDPVESDQMLYGAGLDAMGQGKEDARDAINVPPLMFAGEDYLLSSWRSGYDSEVASQEIWGCRKWHDGSGKPCPIHG